MPEIERLIEREQAKVKAEQALKNGHAVVMAGAEFLPLGDGYRFSLPAVAITLDVERLRRDHHELLGELSVYCGLPGARTVAGGILSTADFNFSSARARTDRAKLLAARANTRDMDWSVVVEEFCQRVLAADRAGQPAVDLRTLPAPAAEDDFQVQGLHLLRRHPSILFGDGGAAKSYLALYLAGRLAERGMRVGIFDWELAGEDHRDRLGRLFSDGMPRILYARCERPLVYEVDRLRRIVKEQDLEFLVYDSVAFACDGPPEAAEAAGRYFRAVRQIGAGSLHIAHVSKGENADQKPFGSAFWHNGARSTWYAKLADGSADTESLHLGLFNRKANLGRLRPPVGFRVHFDEHRTTFTRENVADTPDLAGQLTVCERMKALLRRGAMTTDAIAEEIDAKTDTVNRTARRHKHLFVVIPDGRVALLESRAS
jgi:hypothetical protein